MKYIRYQTRPLYIPAINFPTLRAEMDRLFDVAFPTLSTLQPHGFFSDGPREFPVDLYQDKTAFTLRAALPGFRKEDITVDVTDGILTLTAQQKADETKENATIQERRVSRAVTLPDNLNVDNIKAAYENGILSVTLPKQEEVKPRQIAVEVK